MKPTSNPLEQTERGAENPQQSEKSIYDIPIDRFTSFFFFPVKFSKKDAYFDSDHKNWEKILFKIPTSQDSLRSDSSLPFNYSEYIYFHDYVRQFLFQISGRQNDSEQLETYHYRSHYPKIIELETYNQGKFTAVLNDILLYRCPGDIGILVFETGNQPREKLSVGLKYPLINRASELLLFNNMFRRVYPAYFEEGDFGNKNPACTQMKNCEFPVSLAIVDDGGRKIMHQDISETHLVMNNENKCYYPILSMYINDLIEDFLGRNSENTFFPILDDRMLVYSYSALEKPIAGDIPASSKRVYFSYLLYVDKPELKEDIPTFRYNAEFTENLLKDQMYTRWEHSGTLIGVSRYSAVFQLSEHKDFVLRPFTTMYYRMFLMILYYRCRLICFSDKAASIAREFSASNTKTNLSSIRNHFRELHTQFVKFMNAQWFTEITNQDQGIEIFNLMRRSFELDAMYEQVREEIQRTDELLELIHNQEVEEFNTRAGKIGTIFAMLALMIGYFSMNFENIRTTNGVLDYRFWMATVSTFIVVGIFASAILLAVKRRSFTQWMTLLFGIVLLAFLVMRFLWPFIFCLLS